MTEERAIELIDEEMIEKGEMIDKWIEEGKEMTEEWIDEEMAAT